MRMRTVLSVALLIWIVGLVVGCQVGTSPQAVTTSPPTGATDVSPSAPVTVTVDDGKLTQVGLTNAQGKSVAGALSEDGHSWTAYGYVNFPSHWSVRISNNGEFIHANPETTGVQG